MKIQCTLSIGLIGERVEELDLCECSGKSDAELKALGRDELEQEIYDACKEWAWGYIDFGGEIIPEVQDAEKSA